MIAVADQVITMYGPEMNKALLFSLMVLACAHDWNWVTRNNSSPPVAGHAHAVFPSSPAPSPIARLYESMHVFTADINAVICFDVPFKGVELDGDDGSACKAPRDDDGSSPHHFYPIELP